jgi:hypothetical protein
VVAVEGVCSAGDMSASSATGCGRQRGGRRCLQRRRVALSLNEIHMRWRAGYARVRGWGDAAPGVGLYRELGMSSTPNRGKNGSAAAGFALTEFVSGTARGGRRH